MYYYGPSYGPGPMPYHPQPVYNNNSVSFFSIILIVFLLLIIVGFFYGGNRNCGFC